MGKFKIYMEDIGKVTKGKIIGRKADIMRGIALITKELISDNNMTKEEIIKMVELGAKSEEELEEDIKKELGKLFDNLKEALKRLANESENDNENVEV